MFWWQAQRTGTAVALLLILYIVEARWNEEMPSDLIRACTLLTASKNDV